MRAAIGLVDNMIERVDDLEVPKVVATLSSATTARPTSSASSVGSSTTAPRVTTGTLPGTHTNKGRRHGHGQQNGLGTFLKIGSQLPMAGFWHSDNKRP